MADPYENNTAQDQNWLERNIDWIKPLVQIGGEYMANSAIQKQNQQFNADEAAKQRNWEKEMSNTAYQRGYEDMLKAGLNPNLAGGQGGASTPSGANAASANAPYMDYGSLANVAMTQAQIDNMKADTETKYKQAGKTDAETQAIQIDTEIKQMKAPLEMALTNAQTEKEKSEAQKNIAEYNAKVKELAKMDAEIAELKARGKMEEAQAKQIKRLTKGIQTRAWIQSITGGIRDTGIGIGSAVSGNANMLNAVSGAMGI